MKNILNKITSKYFFANVLISFCIFKNISFINNNTKWVTYIIILYTFFILIYRWFFYRYMFKFSYCLIIYLLIFGTIISAIVNKSIFRYDSIKIIILFIQSFLVLMPNDTNVTYKTSKREFNFFLTYTNTLFIIFSLLSYAKTIFEGRFDRPIGINSDYISFSQVAYLSAAISLYLFFNSRNKCYQIILLLCSVLQFFTLILIQQRAAYLSCFVGFIFFILNEKILCKNTKHFFVTFKVICVIFLLFLIMFVFIQCCTNIFDLNIILKKIATMSLSGRDVIFDCGFRTMIYKNNYLFGSSRGMLANHWSEYMHAHPIWFSNNITSGSTLERLCKEAASHSSFFEQLFNHGLFGFIPLVYFYYIIFASIFKFSYTVKFNNYSNNKIVALLFSFILPAIITASFFDRNLFFDMIFPINVVFFVFVGQLFYFLKKI